MSRYRRYRSRDYRRAPVSAAPRGSVIHPRLWAIAGVDAIIFIGTFKDYSCTMAAQITMSPLAECVSLAETNATRARMFRVSTHLHGHIRSFLPGQFGHTGHIGLHKRPFQIAIFYRKENKSQKSHVLGLFVLLHFTSI